MTLGKFAVSGRSFPAKPEFRAVNPNNLCTQARFIDLGAAESSHAQETGRARRGARATSPRAAKGPLR